MAKAKKKSTGKGRGSSGSSSSVPKTDGKESSSAIVADGEGVQPPVSETGGNTVTETTGEVASEVRSPSLVAAKTGGSSVEGLTLDVS